MFEICYFYGSIYFAVMFSSTIVAFVADDISDANDGWQEKEDAENRQARDNIVGRLYGHLWFC